MKASLARARRELPAAASTAVEIAVDNPLATATVLSGAIVLTRLVERAVMPRTIPQAIAAGLVTNLLAAALFRAAVQRGLVDFRLREDDGTYTRLSELFTEVLNAAGNHPAKT